MDEDKALLSHQMSDAVERGDTAGVVALIVDRDRVLYQNAAGKLAGAPFKPFTPGGNPLTPHRGSHEFGLA